MRKTLTAIACALLVALMAMGGSASTLNERLDTGIPTTPAAPVGNDAGCRTGSNGWGYALPGTPDGPCDYDPVAILHEFDLSYTVIDCPEENMWDCWIYAYTNAPDWSSYEYAYFQCPPGTSTVLDWTTMPPTALPLLGSGSCTFYELGWPNENVDPSQWDFFQSDGSGTDLTFAHTDNLVDALVIFLL